MASRAGLGDVAYDNEDLAVNMKDRVQRVDGGGVGTDIYRSNLYVRHPEGDIELRTKLLSSKD